MARLLSHCTAVGAAVVGAVMLLSSAAIARDYGQLGAVTPVIEPDLLAAIEARLLAAKSAGKFEEINRKMVARTQAKVRRPTPVAGLTTTTQARTWTYDPTITVASDIFDHQGHLIIPAGRKVNPLDTVGLRQSLVFVDADDEAQLRWALKATTPMNAKLILTAGSPFAVMKAEQRRVYFDQEGKLTAKFGIRHTPAVVEQAGRVLKVTELVPPKLAKASQGG